MFRDRKQAGQQLGNELAKLALKDPVVLALPPGGVLVAAEVAKILKAPFDLILVQKVGAPKKPGLAVAALIDGNPPDIVLNREIVEACALADDELRALIADERPQLETQRKSYRRKRPLLPIDGKTAILIDDGAATGTTMKVAIRALRRRRPISILAALPVASPDVVSLLAQEADRIVCLSQPVQGGGLDCHYVNFSQPSPAEIIAAADEMRARSTPWSKGS
ncbi:phosphoribosyltransferase [Mesorhizobium loti]|nr:phosphoribosyltransferase family protein [Mesorhizobium loti]PLP55670.1 phosphoribosyltransferase [Mesorhizobium loti]